MTALVYIIASFSLGATLILTLMPYIKNRLLTLTGNTNSASGFFLFLPASYLVGTLVLGWFTYFSAVLFKNTEKPLFSANILSFLFVIASVTATSYLNRKKLKRWFYEIKKYGFTFSFTSAEWFILLFSAAFWTFFITRSLYMNGDDIRAGVSAVSDFGAHLPVIRSFSEGQIFPAQYPHFPDGTMRYHFMFYFYAGNLEYLGFSLPLALNLPSILSLVSFSMLLYGLCVGITNKTIAGILTCVFFTFRSSFAFFTYSKGFRSVTDFLFAVGNNLDAGGNARKYIGNTLHEDWGLWTQNVYMNQRHLAFAFGIFILALYLLLPLFMNTIKNLRLVEKGKQKVTTSDTADIAPFKKFMPVKPSKHIMTNNKVNRDNKGSMLVIDPMPAKPSMQNSIPDKASIPVEISETPESSHFPKTTGFVSILKNTKLGSYLNELIFTIDSWLPQSFIPCILAGLLLGLTAFWNGAVVISAISVFFIMAAFSKHKLEYLVMAIITLLLSISQTKIFIGSGTNAFTIQYYPGFLSESGSISDISLYYTELLGILPFVLSAIFVAVIARKNRTLGFILSAALALSLVLLMPSIGVLQSIIVIVVCLALLLYMICRKKSDTSLISLWYIPVFAAPIILASTLQLTPDITVNHKYIMLSVILLNIPVADLLANIISTRKKTAILITICVTILLTMTGVIDMFTLYNLDKRSVSYNEKDPVKVWVQENTNRDDIFLTHYMTHYDAPMSVMLAGRSLYVGYPYFTVTAGYDTESRESVMRKIYSASNSNELRTLAISEGIDYIVIEEQNRTAEEYNLNEELFHDAFPIAFSEVEKGVFVFKVR